VINAEIYILVKIRFEKHTVTDAAEKPFGRFIVISVGYYSTVQHKVAMSYRAYSVGADVDKNVYIGGVGAFFVTLLVLQFFNIYLTGIKSLGIAAQGFQRYERGYDLRKRKAYPAADNAFGFIRSGLTDKQPQLACTVNYAI